jgi:hypothetical protein
MAVLKFSLSNHGRVWELTKRGALLCISVEELIRM